ncbi:MAG: PSD1 and planctomycete cytochrome C domain-containing protein [Verrucomicrobiota bacterium]|nr:PSD1 and planctomycete cytochrome C domain-containing protein [Verrucomicrobiota bacterium]
MKIFTPNLFLILIGLAASNAAEVPSDMLFVHKIMPMFKAKCLACHGEDSKKIKGGFDMRTYAGLLKGGESEQPSIVPGKPLQSPLFIAVKREHEDQWEPMPPKENDKLSTEQTLYIREWIEGGAPWPGPDRVVELLKEKDLGSVEGGIRVKTSGGLSETWNNRKYEELKLWAYQPVTKPNLKTGSHPVDALIVARSPEGLVPAPLSESLTLIRRVTFNLTGLLPKPQEVQAFKMAWKEDRNKAWEELIDRLLISPRYGEQMARHWLDIVRYADSAGFSNDYPRPHAWRYRDYVVRSFNNDKPYDQFVREQIAGDEIKPKDPDHLIATGFLRMGPWEHTSMSVKAVTRQQYLDDVVNSVGVTFLANELRCAKCHDHKFDPIPTRDYYRMQAIFAPITFSERKLPWQNFENKKGIKQDHERYQRLMKEKGIRSITSLPEADRPVSQFDEESEKAGHSKINNKRRQQLNYQLKRAKPSVFSVLNGAPDKIHILKGGSIESPQEEVSPGVLSLFKGSEESASLTDNKFGRRKELAKWITSKDNPLTARVIVNRIWQWHFGQALAGNPNNFGGTGKLPTHPELLDWLAATFIEEGWSIKKLHRHILTSATYQRSATHPDPDTLAKLDPDEISYAVFKPRRLTAEELRDSMLTVSGELNPILGGIPCHPEINEEVAMQPRHIMGSVGPAYQADPLPSQRNRRTLYTERIRTLADPMLEVFNKPGPDLSCERRETATIASQAFTMLNSPIIRSRSLAFAARLEKERPGNLNEQIRRAFRLAYHRMPNDLEMKICLEYLANSKKEHEAHQQERVEVPKYVIRQMVEEMTGQAFWWVEDLDIYAGGKYVPDLKPWDVGPATRALGDLCLILFNSNEFIYIY